MRKFTAFFRPRKATLSIEGEKEQIPLQLSSLEEDGEGAIHLDSVDLADVDETTMKKRPQDLVRPSEVAGSHH